MNIISKPISKVIVAITGASGALYGHELIRQLVALPEIEQIGLIFSQNGLEVWNFEKVAPIPESDKIVRFDCQDMFSAAASGSAGFQAMFVTPCSMGTLAHIAAGTTSNLIHRSADVMLKERRPLLLMVRESPFSLIHIENMERVTRAGAVVFPASPFFYHHPTGLHEAVEALVSRMLSFTGIATPTAEWGK